MTELTKKRPEFRNINAFKDLPTYRLPPAGWVSILHRVSGVLMFLLMPFIIWLFDTSLSSEFSFARFRAAFNTGIGFAPGWFVKLVALALIWAYLHHFIAGLRHLWMDVSHTATLLGVAPGHPLLSVERLAYTYNDEPMELRRGYYRTDARHYHNELS